MAENDVFNLSDLDDILNKEYKEPDEAPSLTRTQLREQKEAEQRRAKAVTPVKVKAGSEEKKTKTKKTEKSGIAPEPDNRVRSFGKKPKVKSKKKKEYSSLKTLLIIAVCFFLICFGIISFYAYKVTNSDRSFPNVCAADFPLGDKARTEIEGMLKTVGWDEQNDKGLTVHMPCGISFKLDYVECGAAMPASEVVDIALAYGRDGTIYENLLTYIRCLTKKVDVTENKYNFNNEVVKKAVAEAAVSFDEAMNSERMEVDTEKGEIRYLKISPEVTLNETILYEEIVKAFRAKEHDLNYCPATNRLLMPNFSEIHEELFAEMANAEFTEKFEIIPDVLGVDFDISEAETLWKSATIGETVVIPLKITKPTTVASDLDSQLFRDLLGDYTTSFEGSTENRISNLRLIAEKLDGFILYPGEEFSYNVVIGERTAEAGFKEAAAYDGEEVVQQIGGGVCQGSSTLHAAALKAQMTILERSAHNFNPGYLPASLDATVSWPTPHFRFSNPWDHPVKIHAYLDETAKTMTIEIWGTNTEGTYVEIKTYSWPFYHEKYPDVQTMVGGRYEIWKYDKEGNLLDVFGDTDDEKAKTISFYHLHMDEIDFKGNSIPYEELYNFYGQQ